jgi:hypothetical protein
MKLGLDGAPLLPRLPLSFHPVSAASLLPDPVWTFPCHFTFCDIWPLGQCHLLCGPFRCWSEAVFRLALGFTFPALETLSPVCCTVIHHSGWIRSLGPAGPLPARFHIAPASCVTATSTLCLERSAFTRGNILFYPLSNVTKTYPEWLLLTDISQVNGLPTR